jgi:hypothetical protein
MWIEYVNADVIRLLIALSPNKMARIEELEELKLDDLELALVFGIELGAVEVVEPVIYFAKPEAYFRLSQMGLKMRIYLEKLDNLFSDA